MVREVQRGKRLSFPPINCHRLHLDYASILAPTLIIYIHTVADAQGPHLYPFGTTILVHACGFHRHLQLSAGDFLHPQAGKTRSTRESLRAAFTSTNDGKELGNK